MADVIFAPGFDQRPTQGLGRIGELLMQLALRRSQQDMDERQLEISKRHLLLAEKKQQSEEKAKAAQQGAVQSQLLEMLNASPLAQAMPPGPASPVAPQAPQFGGAPPMPVGIPGALQPPGPSSPVQMPAGPNVGGATMGVPAIAERIGLKQQVAGLSPEDQVARAPQIIQKLTRARARQLVPQEYHKALDMWMAMQDADVDTDLRVGIAQRILPLTSLQRLDLEKAEIDLKNIKDARSSTAYKTGKLKEWGLIGPDAPEIMNGADELWQAYKQGKEIEARAERMRNSERAGPMLEKAAKGVALGLAKMGTLDVQELARTLTRSYPLLDFGVARLIAYEAIAEVTKAGGGVSFGPADLEAANRLLGNRK